MISPGSPEGPRPSEVVDATIAAMEGQFKDDMRDNDAIDAEVKSFSEELDKLDAVSVNILDDKTIRDRFELITNAEGLFRGVKITTEVTDDVITDNPIFPLDIYYVLALSCKLADTEFTESRGLLPNDENDAEIRKIGPIVFNTIKANLDSTDDVLRKAVSEVVQVDFLEGSDGGRTNIVAISWMPGGETDDRQAA